MNNTIKKCPMCAEQIPLAAVTCEYCGAQFTVTINGYCQNCHQVRNADENGQCKVCGNAVMDLRVESKLIEEPAQKPLPISQPIAQIKTSKNKKSRLPIGILVGMLIFAVIGAFLWFGRNNLPAVPSVFVTSTPTVITTFTPARTPTATSMRTPPPTRTATPIPTWVTEFAEPILAAIANTPPHFEDDFSQESDGWRFDVENGDRCRVKIKDGAFTMSVETGREAAWCKNPGMRMNNFVLRVDIDFSELGSADSAQIGWRGIGDSGVLALSLLRDGSWSIYACDNNPCTYFDSGRQVISPTQKVTITIISQGAEHAIYINEIPVSYINDIERRPGRVIKLGLEVPSNSPNPMIAYDNLKIWNLDYIPNLP